MHLQGNFEEVESYLSGNKHLEQLSQQLFETNEQITGDLYYNQERDWSNLQGSYGAYTGNLELLSKSEIIRHWETLESVLDEQLFTGNGYDSLPIIENILNTGSNGNKRYSIYSKNQTTNSISIFDINTGTYINNFTSGLLYTINNIRLGIPVVFGVNSSPFASDDNDGTNHYIIIVGLGNDGRNYLRAWDIACLFANGEPQNTATFQEGLATSNKLYLDSNWPGLLRADLPWPNFYAASRQPYKVTKILKTYTL